MKFLIVFACALAAATAGNLVTPFYPGEQHLPVIGPNGVPIDTPAVQQATAEHLVHKVEAQVRNGDYVHSPVVTYPVHHQVEGLPLDTVEVAAAKIQHFAAHEEALARTGHNVFYRARRGVVSPVAYTSAYTHAPVVATSAYSYPYVHSSAVLYRRRRGVVAPVAYTAGYHHSPVVTGTTYSYPYVHSQAVLYRKRRGFLAPVAYTTGYHHSPAVSHHSVYSAIPNLHHY